MLENQTKKVIIVGNTSVGKTALLIRMTTDDFIDTYPTVGPNFKSMQKNIDGKDYDITIFDTAGSEKYHALTKQYIHNSSVALICFERNDPNPIKSIKFWKEMIKEVQVDVNYIYVRTKDDINQENNENEKNNEEEEEEEGERLKEDEVENIATNIKAYIEECGENVDDFVITSAKTRYGIQNLINKIFLKAGPIKVQKQQSKRLNIKDCC